MPAFSERRISILVGIGLFLATMVVYWPASRNAFINFDDDVYVTKNAEVKRGLTTETVAWAFRSTEHSNWHPLTWLSHQLDVSIWGAGPEAAFGHHLTNLLLHAANSVLVFVAWKRLTTRLWPSALVAGLFAWHPLHVESVAWVAERKDLLCCLFWFVTLVAYARYCEKRSWANYGLVLLSVALALMSKPMAVTLPCVLLLLDFWPLGRFSGGEEKSREQLMGLVVEKLPLFGLVIGSAAITYFAQEASGAVVEVPLRMRLANAALSYVTYLAQTFVPANLAVFYPYPEGQPPWALVGGAAALLAGISFAALLFRRRVPYLFVGWFWYVGTLVPVIGFVQVGGQAHADRYTYIPLVGIFVTLAWSLAALVASLPRARTAGVATCCAALLACMILARHQLAYWKDSATLFTRATEISPRSSLAWVNLGGAYLDLRRPSDAVASYRRALEIEMISEAESGLATALAASGEGAEAIRILKRQYARTPDDVKLANNLAWALATQRQDHLREPDEAIRLAEHANRLSGGDDPTILDTLAAAYASGGRFAEAVNAANRAVAAARAQNDEGLARSIAERGRLFAAGQAYREG